MRTIFKCLYGSHLYGCSVPTSDKDYKGVFIYSLDELIRRKPDNLQWKDTDLNEEHEMYYIQRFANLLASGQTVAYSMLFAPDDMVMETSAAWTFLRMNQDKVVSRMLKPFVGYARSQAQKYSLKGEKLRTLEDTIAFLTPRLDIPPKEYWDQLILAFQDRQGIRFWSDQSGDTLTRMVEICGKSFGETTDSKLWLEPLNKLRGTYGSRSLEAKEQNGMDLKALYHAVRICSEMNEILRDGVITYPRPEAELLMDIRLGRLTNGDISSIIDRLMEEGDALLLTSKIREKPDMEFLESWYVAAQTISIEGEVHG